MRNKSLTKERIEEYWKLKKKIEEEHLQAISASTSLDLTPQVSFTEECGATKEYKRSSSLPEVRTKDGHFNLRKSSENDLEDFINKNGWWTKSNWAFLNEPPVTASEVPRYKIKMPDTFVVHLGNSKELMEIAENTVAKRVLREHVREALGVRNEDLLFAIINSVSRGKGQDLFLRSFHESLQIIKQKKLEVPPMHAVVVGSDMSKHTTMETELRSFASDKRIQDRVHFINKTLTVAPYLAAIDVLVQNSQGRGECFGRITIEAMAFQLPVLGTAAGGTMEIVVNGTTGLLHPAGKEGVSPLAKNMVKLATHVERRLTMGKKGYERVKERFLEPHMAQRIAFVLKEVLRKANHHT